MRRNERREADRVPVGIYLNQVVGSDLHRCFATDISPTGLYMERTCTPMERRSNFVQVEIPLPGIGDTLWAKAEVVYDCFDALFHGTAIRFAAMAGMHRRLLEAWLHETGRTLHVDAVGFDDSHAVRAFRPPPVVIRGSRL